MATKDESTKTEESGAKVVSTVDREGAIDIVRKQLGKYLKAAKLEVLDTPESFANVLDDALAYGTDTAIVEKLARYHGLRRVRDQILANGDELPKGLQDEVAEARIAAIATYPKGKGK